MSTPRVPLDTNSLLLLRESLDVAMDAGGNVPNGKFTLSRLLNFWGGYDERRTVEVGEGIDLYDFPSLSERDVIRALVDEVLEGRMSNV